MSAAKRRRESSAAGSGAARERLSLAVGLAGILAIAVIAYLSFTKENPLDRPYRVEAVFQSSNQLRPGAPVRIAGVNAGSVSGFRDGPGTTQIVTMELSEDARPIHADATLRIRPRLFLEGGYIVELDPGSPSARELGPADPIPLAQTAIPVQLDQILGIFDTPTRDAASNALGELAHGFGGGGAEGLGSGNADLGPLLSNMAVLGESLRGTEQHDLSEFVAGASRAADVLGERDHRIESLLANVNRSSAVLATHDEDLSATVRESAPLLEQAPTALAQLDRALPSIDRFNERLQPALALLPGVLTDSADLLDQVRGLSSPGELPRLLDVSRPTLEELPVTSRRLQELFPLVTPVTDCVRDRAVPVLESKLDDDHLSTGRPVWQDLAHALSGVASFGQSFDGNGPIVRLNGTLGESAVAVGQLPDGATLLGRPPEPILGTRPLWLGPGVTPPYRPDAPCTEQAAPDLTARTDATVSLKQAPPPSDEPSPELRKLYDELRREAARGREQ